MFKLSQFKKNNTEFTRDYYVLIEHCNYLYQSVRHPLVKPRIM